MPDKQVNHIARKSMSNLVLTLRFRAVGQTHVKWQTFENPVNKRQMYGSQAWVDWLPYICLLFSGFSNVCHFTCIWPRALKLGCITKYVDMLFLTMGLICLLYMANLSKWSWSHLIFLFGMSAPTIPSHWIHKYKCCALFWCRLSLMTDPHWAALKCSLLVIWWTFDKCADLPWPLNATCTYINIAIDHQKD